MKKILLSWESWIPFQSSNFFFWGDWNKTENTKQNITNKTEKHKQQKQEGATTPPATQKRLKQNKTTKTQPIPDGEKLASKKAARPKGNLDFHTAEREADFWAEASQCAARFDWRPTKTKDNPLEEAAFLLISSTISTPSQLGTKEEELISSISLLQSDSITTRLLLLLGAFQITNQMEPQWHNFFTWTILYEVQLLYTFWGIAQCERNRFLNVKKGSCDS